MQMVEGFWIIQFESMTSSGGGVAVFIKGRIFGGDSGTMYIGTYKEAGNAFKARVRIHNYAPNVVSVLGIEGDYDLDVTGTVEGDVIKGSGLPSGQQSPGLALKLTRAASLPT
jgi:hypothetical protein